MTSSPSQRDVRITGPSGLLEGVLHSAAPTVGEKHPGSANSCSRPTRCAVVAHPHPLYGGTMHNAVVAVAAQTLVQQGFSTLRFNFRGVGESTGVHDHGDGERFDLWAADRWLREQVTDASVVVWLGYSFGAAVALSCLETAAQPAGVHPRGHLPQATVLLAPPLSMRDFSFVSGLAHADGPPPLALITGERDELTPPEALQDALRWPGLRHAAKIDGAGHDLSAHQPRQLSEAIRQCLVRLELASPQGPMSS